MAINLEREGVALNAEERNKRNNNLTKIEQGLNEAVKAVPIATEAKEIAETAEGKVDNVQTQLNTLVVEGDSSPQAIQASVGADGTEYGGSLKARLDAEHNKVAGQLAETSTKVSHIINVADFGAIGGADESVQIQSAIDYANSLGGGTVQFGNKTYRAQGLTPKPNVTLQGTGASILKLIDDATNHLIYYYNTDPLVNFNLKEIILDGNSQIIYNVVHISEPTPNTSNYTWDKSIIDNCIIRNGGVGVYCEVPGSVKIINTVIEFNDIGIKQSLEHFYLTNVTVWHNRIGADIYRANHFTWINAIFAHSSECGILADASYENVLNSCSFIDNVTHLKGPIFGYRILGSRFIGAEKGISGAYHKNIINGCYFQDLTDIAIETHLSAFGNIIIGNMFNTNNRDIFISGSEQSIKDNSFRQTRKISVEVGGGNLYGLTFTGNSIMNASTDGSELYPAMKLTPTTITTGIIANNLFRNDGSGLASHGIYMDSTTTVVSDLLVIGNVARAMKTTPYQLKTATTQANNIGAVVTI